MSLSSLPPHGHCPFVTLVDTPSAPYRKTKLTYVVVMRLIEGLWDHGHFVTMDNFFTSIELFNNFLSRGIYMLVAHFVQIASSYLLL